MPGSSKTPPTHSRRKNPFTESYRNNFPGLDFGSGEKESIHSSLNSKSECSFESSSLNMSIGARAALNEHRRHIAKFGIDGEVSRCDETDTSRNILDEQWENLLDGNTSQVDLSSSIHASPSSYRRLEVLLSNQQESIEVKTDVSQDFFNSSRVLMLATPDRQKGKRIEAVMTRKELQDQAPYEDEDYDLDLSGNMAPELRASLGHSENSTAPNSSSTFLSAADISRISASDSEPRRSPSGSFEMTFDIGSKPFSPIIDEISPSKSFSASSDISLRNSDISTPKLPPLSTPSKQSFSWQRHRSGSRKKMRAYPHMTPTPGFSPSVSPLNPAHAMSPAAAMAGSRASELLKAYGHIHQREQKKCASSLDNMPREFIRAIDQGRAGNITSPFSQMNISFNNFEASIEDRSDESFTTRSLKRHRMERTSSSLSSSSMSSDRRLFRTVVPTRVFMSSPSQFPEEEDSFSANRPNRSREKGQTSKSLLDSFEACHER